MRDGNERKNCRQGAPPDGLTLEREGASWAGLAIGFDTLALARKPSSAACAAVTNRA
jgi:hypothetical protein